MYNCCCDIICRPLHYLFSMYNLFFSQQCGVQYPILVVTVKVKSIDLMDNVKSRESMTLDDHQ